jgi:hypothetical protein
VNPEHEVVNYQLLAVVKEVCQTLFSIRGIEFELIRVSGPVNIAGVWDVPFAWIIFLISVIYGAVTPRLWLAVVKEVCQTLFSIRGIEFELIRVGDFDHRKFPTRGS